MSNQHPYPLPIQVAVAKTVARQILVMRDWRDLPQQTRDAFLDDSNEILTELWKASRIDSVEQLEQLPDDVTVAGDGFTGLAEYIRHDELPVYVTFWGDHDDR